MNSDDNQTQDILSALRDPTILVPPLFTEREPIEKVTDVHKEYAMAILVGEDITKDALSWREFKYNTNWNIIWLLLLSIEDTSLGSPYINISKQQSPIAYEATVHSLARQYLSLADTNDKTRIKFNVKNSHFINKTQLQDIQDAFECEKKKEKEKKDKKPNKKKKKNEEEDEDEEEEEEQLVEEIEEEIAVDFQTLLEKYMDSDLVVFINETGPRNQKEGPSGLDKESFLVPTISDQVSPKATLTLTPIPSVDNKNKVVGYLVRVVQHDPRWNPGEMVLKLCSQCEQRNEAKDARSYKEPWPQYVHLTGSNFIVHNMSLGKWFETINTAKGGQRPNFNGTTEQFAQVERIDVFDSANHPLSVCSLDVALERLSRAGGDIGEFRDYGNGDNTIRWPKHLETFRYFSPHVFWDHERYVGLFTQYFPKAINAEHYFGKEMCLFLDRCQLIERKEVVHKSAHAVGYRTNNMFVYYAAEANELEEKLIPFRQQNQFIYANELKKVNEVCKRKFNSIMQLDGTPTYLPIPPSIKACIAWYQEYTKTHDTLSLDTEIYDPGLDIYSNHVIRLLALYNICGKMLLPNIVYKLHCLFTVYRQRKPGRQLPNIGIHGAHGDGKSSILDYFSNLSIPGTFMVISRSTDAADQTDVPVHDEIRGTHEAEEAFIDSRVAKRHANKVNMKKTALSEGKVTVKRYEDKQVPGGGKLHGFRISTQATEYSEITLSNSIPDDTALASRSHNILLVKSSIPFEEWKHNLSKKKVRKVIDVFRVNQFLCMMLYKAMMVYAVPCREPFMKLFHDISAKICECLREWGILHESFVAGRAIDIMEQTACQKTIERACVLTWHVKGAPHHGKPFHPDQMDDAAPVAYCTSAITLETWTAHASDVIKPEYESVLRASALCMLNREYDVEKTPLDYYFEDYQNKISWKRDRDYTYHRGDKDRNLFLLDLNYFEFNGTLEQVAMQIAERTENPHLRTPVVQNILESMSKRSFVPHFTSNGRNGYARGQSLRDLEEYHKGKLMNKEKLTPNNYISSILALCSEISPVFVFGILQKINTLQPFEYRTFSQGMEILKVLGPIEIVFLHLLFLDDPTIRVETVGDLQELSKTSKTITEQQRQLILSCFNFTLQEQRALPGNYCYRYGRVILYLISQDKILHPNSKKSNYLLRNKIRDENGYPHFACEQDIPMLGNIPMGQKGKNAIQIVDLSRKGRVCISPLAIEQFNKNIILDAFNFSTISNKSKPAKYILGWTEEADPTKLKTMTLTNDLIQQGIKDIDDARPQNAIARSQGVAFKRREYISDQERVFLYGSMNPEDEQDEQCKAPIEIVGNIDEWAALQQHNICGRPASEPVRTPEWLRENYKGPIGNMDYPHGIISQRVAEAETKWVLNSVSSYKHSRNLIRIAPDQPKKRGREESDV